MGNLASKAVRLFCIAAILTVLWVMPAAAEEQLNLNWVEGGQKVDLGSNLAELQLDKSLVFLNGDDTRKLETAGGGKPTGREIGSVYPMDEQQNWALYFEYEDVGHIKDDEKDEIDADALLDSYKQGTEEANKEKQPENQLFVDGWDIAPFYDEAVHSLSWSLLAHTNSNEKIINYNVRILTREGFISAILVSDPAHLAEHRKMLNSIILPNLKVKTGQQYSDFDESTDKVAEYGLTGLILGGAGIAVAKKLGFLLLLKKFWYLILAGIVFVWRLVVGLFRKKKQQSEQGNAAPAAEAPAGDNAPDAEVAAASETKAATTEADTTNDTSGKM